MVSSVQSSQTPAIPELIEGLPNICGWENVLQAVVHHKNPVFLPTTNLKLSDITAGFAIALHMHQPTIPAQPGGKLISNLQYMFEHPYEGDNHNAGPFAYCYARMADFIPELVAQGCNPRIMLNYSGNLLWGLRQMGRGEILEKLKRITCEPTYQPYVEWLGTMWSHAIVPSTPLADIKLHIQAWQHHFAAIFGWEALARVKGFSAPDLHLPNHPDTLYTFITALKDCGYRWLLVQEHSVETLTGTPLRSPHLPHRLIARNAQGETSSITVLIKTKGLDSKLVGQMQPYYEAKTLDRQSIHALDLPPLVTQIADGENSGVMMNEFPGMFKRAWHEMRHEHGGRAGIVGFTGTEYLELLEASGYSSADYPVCQAAGQHRIWAALEHSSPHSALPETIRQLQQADPTFHIDGTSWIKTSNWSKGHDTVLTPMIQLSALFHKTIDPLLAANQDISAPLEEPLTRQSRYRRALLHNLLLQTSCFRYWGQGIWSDYARDIHRRGESILRTDF